ncbi:TraL conjugative transposon family protein [Bacteroides fragilis]|nr:TraL conjugative transposon family protein [Bacteroides fragilis]
MRKLIERLGKWTDNRDERLRAWLEALPQRTKLAVVLVIFGLFALCALFTFGTALYEIGRESGRQIEIEHIRQLDLRQRQDSINFFKYYDYGTERTEQKSYGLSQRGEA